MEVVRAAFKPEFLNRLDDIVMFHPLSEGDLEHIVGLQLAALQRRLDDRRITLDVSEAAKGWLARRGFDPIYGARPLRRLVQTAVGDPLARELLSGQVRDGSIVRIDAPGWADAAELTVEPA